MTTTTKATTATVQAGEPNVHHDPAEVPIGALEERIEILERFNTPRSLDEALTADDPGADAPGPSRATGMRCSPWSTSTRTEWRPQHDPADPRPRRHGREREPAPSHRRGVRGGGVARVEGAPPGDADPFLWSATTASPRSSSRSGRRAGTGQPAVSIFTPPGVTADDARALIGEEVPS